MGIITISMMIASSRLPPSFSSGFRCSLDPLLDGVLAPFKPKFSYVFLHSISSSQHIPENLTYHSDFKAALSRAGPFMACPLRHINRHMSIHVYTCR